MTGALNRRAFFERVEARLASPEAAPRGAALFVIDVDHFKRSTTASVTRSATWRLPASPPSSAPTCATATCSAASVARNSAPSSSTSTRPPPSIIAERCRLAVGECCFAPERDAHPLSVSIGIAFPDRRTDLPALYKLADDRLYAAKAQGRNRIERRAHRCLTGPA